jgi:hypothetical protein
MSDCNDNVVVVNETNPVVQITPPAQGFVAIDEGNTFVKITCNEEVVVVQQNTTFVRLTEVSQVPITEENVTVIVNEDITQVVSIGEQGPAGPAGGALQTNTSVNAAGTVTADSVSLGADQGVDWVVIATDTATGAAVYARVNVIAVHRVSAVTHAVYGRMGDRIFTVDVDILSGEMRLRVTNNHTESLDVNVLRFATLIA